MCKVPACTAKYASFAARPSNSSYAEARHGHFRLQRRKILDCSRLLLKISNYPQAREHNGKHSFDEVYVYHIEYGIPNEIVAVFGTQYTSAEFRKRCKDCGINLTFSSPHHHQANSVAERSVGTIKQLWKKADESGQCRGTAVLMYRSTPLDGTMQSPYELLFNRKPNTFLPTAGKALNPRHVDYEDHLVQNQQRQQDQAKSYDRRHGAIYRELYPSEPVSVYNTINRVWEPGYVVQQTQPRTYIVNKSGRELFRTREHIKPRSAPMPKVTNENIGSSINRAATVKAFVPPKQGVPSMKAAEAEVPPPAVETPPMRT